METEILKNGTRVYSDGGIKLCADPLLLAHFCAPKPRERGLDLGCGCGAVSLALRDAGFSGELTAVDIDGAACALARRGSLECAVPFEVLEADLRSFKIPSPADFAACNPPFFAQGATGKGYRAGARHDVTLTLGELGRAAKRLVRFGGRLCVCIRPERLEDLLCALRENGFATKRLRFARHAPSALPWLALVEARSGAGSGLALEPDFVLHDAAGALSGDALKIFTEKATQP